MSRLELAVPDGWTPLHSIAFLLLGVGVADGVLEGPEVENIVEIMARYEGIDPDAAAVSVRAAHSFVVAVQQGHGREGWLKALTEHMAILANRFDRRVLRSLLSDMIDIARSDGDLADEELLFIQSAASMWGLGAEA